MKTILIFDQIGQDDIKFLVVEGDYTHLAGKFINSTETSDEDADTIDALFFYPEGHKRFGYLRDEVVNEFPIDIVKTYDTRVVVCGFLP